MKTEVSMQVKNLNFGREGIKGIPRNTGHLLGILGFSLISVGIWSPGAAVSTW